MKISLLDAKSTALQLMKLIEKHDHISIAVAWGGIVPVAEVLLANKAKFDSVILGLDFSATDPDLIDRLVDVPNAFVAKNRRGCFHPKVFYFQSGDEAAAIVGSSNFTTGGLGGNFEANAYVQGAANAAFFEQVRNKLNSYNGLRLQVTQQLADSYRRQVEAASATPRPKNPVLPNEGKDWMRNNSQLGVMQWKEFAALAREDRYHDFGRRMALLRAVQTILSKAPSFSGISIAEAKGIAGVLGASEANDEGLSNLDWGWFGSMGGAGVFAKLIGNGDKKLTAALDGIPKRGNVTEDQFNDYVHAFTQAFSGYSRTARLGPATRLLAMKRPDFFVCVNGGNKRGLGAALAVAPSTTNLKNYWERVIKPIQQAPWYNTRRPTGRDMELWDSRVAMLDAIYYQF